jgi:hypothetical protein
MTEVNAAEGPNCQHSSVLFAEPSSYNRSVASEQTLYTDMYVQQHSRLFLFLRQPYIIAPVTCRYFGNTIQTYIKYHEDALQAL